MGSPVTITPDPQPVSITPDAPAQPAQSQGLTLSNPSTVPNARIRNLPNPAAGETSALGALYHGAKTGAMLASIPASTAMSAPQLLGSLIGGTVGNQAGTFVAKHAGVGPMGQEVAGDIGGLVGGIYGANRIGSPAQQFLDNFQRGFNPPAVTPRPAPLWKTAGVQPTTPGFDWQSSTPEEIQAQISKMASRPAPTAVPKPTRPAPAWQTNPQPVTEIPIQGSTPEEIQAQLSKMASRAKTVRPQGAPVDAHVPENPTQNIPLPEQIQPTKATLVDPYRNQVLPQMKPITSTTIEAHGYNPAGQQAFVHFKNGNIYRLSGVPPEMYDQFQNAESQGSFYAQNFKGRYQTDLVGKVKATRGSAGQQAKDALSR